MSKPIKTKSSRTSTNPNTLIDMEKLNLITINIWNPKSLNPYHRETTINTLIKIFNYSSNKSTKIKTHFLNHINIIKIAQTKSHITLRLLIFGKKLTKYKNLNLELYLKNIGSKWSLESLLWIFSRNPTGNSTGNYGG